jgi:cytochrome c-type biogenesis protein CcmH
MKALLFSILIGFSLTSLAFAVDPEEQLNDPKLEARARAISAGLRCLVCQNESIDESDASLAKDLRLLVRRRLQAGATDKEVVDYIVSRYGEFVLLRPRFSTKTALLWAAPLILVLGGAALAARTFMGGKREATTPEPLSADEEKDLAQLLAARSRAESSNSGEI